MLMATVQIEITLCLMCIIFSICTYSTNSQSAHKSHIKTMVIFYEKQAKDEHQTQANNASSMKNVYDT